MSDTRLMTSKNPTQLLSRKWISFQQFLFSPRYRILIQMISDYLNWVQHIIWYIFICKNVYQTPLNYTCIIENVIHQCCSYRNLDIRDAILQLLNVIRDGSKAVDRHDRNSKDTSIKMLKALEEMARNGINGKSFEKKIDNISTFLLRFL